MDSEADTCRKFILPKITAAGWTDDQILEQRYFTDGRIVVTGNKAVRRPGKRADYILRLTRDVPLAVIEAKTSYKKAADGLQQAKEYAQMLKLRFAYASNGKSIIEFDFITGLETELTEFPSANELWERLRKSEKLTNDKAAESLLTPSNTTTDKEPRYYQRIAKFGGAIDRAGGKADTAHDGDGYRQNGYGVPNLLEAVVGQVEFKG